MGFKINKISLNLLIFSALLFSSLIAFSITGDTKQPIYIESNAQSIDMQNNIVTFTGNVTVTQGTIKINTDRVIVTRSSDEQEKEIIDSYGNPVIFYQMQDNGKLMKGCALHMHYEVARDLVILTGNAYLERLGSNITSDKIIYFVKEQKMQACSKKGNRITTVLVPPQLQDKKMPNHNIENN